MNRASDNGTDDETIVETTPSTAFGQYLTLQILMIISLPCYFFNFYYLLTNGALRRAIHNHAIILLLVSNFIMVIVDVPMQLNVLRTGFVWPRNEIFCHFYLFIDYYLFVTSLLVMVFTSFERHILIFHKNLISTRHKRIFIHYVPMIICVGYPLIFYVCTILLYPCSTYYDSTTESCMYDTIVHGTIPNFLVIAFNVALLIRVVQQKRRMRQNMSWSQHRKITVQMLGISSLCLLTNLPYYMLVFVALLNISSYQYYLEPYFIMILYFASTFLPFVCLSSLPELWKKVTRRTTTVTPARNFPTAPIIKKWTYIAIYYVHFI